LGRNTTKKNLAAWPGKFEKKTLHKGKEPVEENPPTHSGTRHEKSVRVSREGRQFTCAKDARTFVRGKANPIMRRNGN